jgi:anaerobic magnesium-protoporphyrin IX monomethyl ester cyclase
MDIVEDWTVAADAASAEDQSARQQVRPAQTDLSLVFVPQWSPFQPALSLPALSAWLKRAGYATTSLDANLLFYEWLFSEECAVGLARQARDCDLSSSARAAYLSIFANAAAFRDDLARLRRAPAYDESRDSYVARSYLCVQAFETYLNAISEISGDFIISPYEFRFRSGNLEANEIEARLNNPHWLLEQFVRSVVSREVLSTEPSMVGLSCIGQEQLYFTLLFGKHIKELADIPVIIGGTIFSRIFERGVLRRDWFGRYFDIIVRNEGERPSECLLRNQRDGKAITEGVPGIVYRRGGQLEAPIPAAPLSPLELPVPDFDDLPLGRYVSPEITLPLLTARGCYWGKCEFCHHGMVYGEKYAPYKPVDVLEAVKILTDRYGVRHFAFNDEAIPPKILRSIGDEFPPHDETGWTFTGLIKFEPTYKREDFEQFHRAGCRSLYVGLESASERVLDLMKKRSARSTIVNNLRDATQSGIWMHCFLFFGFPGEGEDDARITVDFIVEHKDIVSSYGAGTFSLEHNSPIFHHYGDYGVRLKSNGSRDLDVYYAYEVEDGIDADRALQWRDELRRATEDISHYRASNWIPRELLLCLLSTMTADELLRVGPAVRECGGLPPGAAIADFLTWAEGAPSSATPVLINRVNGRVFEIGPSAERLMRACFDAHIDAATLEQAAPDVFARLAHFQTESDGVELPARTSLDVAVAG